MFPYGVVVKLRCFKFWGLSGVPSTDPVKQLLIWSWLIKWVALILVLLVSRSSYIFSGGWSERKRNLHLTMHIHGPWMYEAQIWLAHSNQAHNVWYQLYISMAFHRIFILYSQEQSSDSQLCLVSRSQTLPSCKSLAMWDYKLCLSVFIASPVSAGPSEPN